LCSSHTAFLKGKKGERRSKRREERGEELRGKRKRVIGGE
jgi:hypothetical protein